MKLRLRFGRNDKWYWVNPTGIVAPKLVESLSDLACAERKRLVSQDLPHLTLNISEAVRRIGYQRGHPVKLILQYHPDLEVHHINQIKRAIPLAGEHIREVLYFDRTPQRMFM